ncbi:MAG: radical SAM protein [Spirochaetales bacterium]|nr:radical SAM protein [Spirochaetales bacterium]
MNMAIASISAKTILRKQKRIESWFLSRYGMNLYRGCLHDCIYCDGRAEAYRVDGDFGRDVQIKENAPDVLARELDSTRRRNPLPRGLIFVGGGVSDSYQAVERRYRITRRVLATLRDRRRPVHVLTKSTLVERDTDLLKAINGDTRALVSFSFSTVDDRTARILEPGVPAPSDRLAAIRRLSDAGLPCGAYLLPIVPFFSDGAGRIEESFASFREAGAAFVVAGGLTLKEGRQKEHFLAALRRRRPEVVPAYLDLYPAGTARPYGEAVINCEGAIAPQLIAASERYELPLFPPVSIVEHCISENDRVVAILDQIGALLRIRGVNSPFGYAAHCVATFSGATGAQEPLPRDIAALCKIPGVGGATARLILEIIETGTARRYDELRSPWLRRRVAKG